MSSTTYRMLRDHLKDVDRLIATHNELNSGGRGRRAFGHLTRSGVVQLCAAWEVFAEDLLVEAVKYLARELDSPTDLPLGVKQKLCKKVRDEKDDLEPLKLAGDGWRELFIAYASRDVKWLNSPRSVKVDELYERHIGLQNLSESWSRGAAPVDDFITVRGGIAHRGRAAKYPSIAEVVQYRDLISDVIKDTDNRIGDYLNTLVPHKRKPWNRVV